jgi:hypothetical protein
MDLACRALKTALRSKDFQKMPSVVAVIQSTLNVLQKLITSYTAGTPGDLSTPVTQNPSSGGGTADADSQPDAANDGEGGKEGT